jgi:hypothetical protein
MYSQGVAVIARSAATKQSPSADATPVEIALLRSQGLPLVD